MVKKILVLNASPSFEHSHSRNLAQHFLNELTVYTIDPYEVIERDLAREDLPHINAENFEAFISGAPTAKAAEHFNTLCDQLINELIVADAILIATPMHNFSVPGTLKAYIDLILRAGKTFKYTEHGPQGLLENKPTILVTTSGGYSTGTPHDHLTPYMLTILGFIGITDVTVVNAQGLAMKDKRDDSLHQAQQALSDISKHM